jgi:hypothetical protein
VCCIAVTVVVQLLKLGGNEVRLRHFSLRQVKSHETVALFDVDFFTDILSQKK